MLLFVQLDHLYSKEYTSAEKLNKLNVVIGDGKSYLEDKQMTRAESLVLILRLLKINEIGSASDYSDVLPTDWFYESVVNGSSMGIVNGYSDLTFKPNDPITEKSFVKMLLELLGYEYAKDYTWDEVGRFSYSIGLSSEIDVTEKPILRGRCFDLVVQALETKSKNSKVKYIDQIYLEKVITEDEYKDYRAISLFSPVKVESLMVSTSDSIVLSFTENLAAVQEKAVFKLLLKDNSTVIIKSDNIKFQGNQILINFEDNVGSGSIQLVCEGLVDKYYSNIEKIELPLNINELNSDYDFFVKSISSSGRNSLVVEFSEPINDDTLDLKKIRVVKNNRQVFFSLKKYTGNKIILVLEEQIDLEDLVEVNLQGSIEDLYGNELLDGLTMSYRVSVDENTLADLKVENIQSIGNRIIRITYNQPIDLVNGLDRLNYELNDLSKVTGYFPVDKIFETGTGEYKNRQFDIISNQLDESNLFYFKVTNQSRIGEDVTIEQQQIRFDYVTSKFALAIKAISDIDNQHLKVTFNQQLSQDKIDNAIIKVGGFTTSRSRLNDDKMSIDIYPEKQLESNKNYVVEIENLESEYGVELSKVSKSFSSGKELRGELTQVVSRNSKGDLIITFDEKIKSLVEKTQLVIYKIYENDTLVALNNWEFETVSDDQIKILKADEADEADEEGIKAYRITNVYLYGDDFYVGSINIELNE